MSGGYSDDEVEAIGGWLREGLSGSQICVEFGRKFRHVTRNAIIGVVHRDRRLKAIGFMGKPRGGAPKPKRRFGNDPSPGSPTACKGSRGDPTSPARGEVRTPRLHAGNILGKKLGRAFDPGLPVAAAPSFQGPAKLLADLEWRECRWPVNDARPGEDHLFCAGPRDPWGGPYCPAHTLRAGAGYTAGQKLGRQFVRAA